MAQKTMDTALRGVAMDQFAKELCSRLLAEGFIIYRYNAYSSNSIYLKLDFGVCNSIRISDHDGKGYLKYRYNIGSHIDRKIEKQDKYPRFYYPISACEDMVQKILADRSDKIRRYGRKRYNDYMATNKKAHENDKGFWSKSRRVF